VARVLTTAFVTVTATEIDKNAPTKFATADMATATLGLSASVAIDVAIALPVSWKPLVKSKPRAVTTTRTKINVSELTHKLGPGNTDSSERHSRIHSLFIHPFLRPRG
jgi:hypothetical protein